MPKIAPLTGKLPVDIRLFSDDDILASSHLATVCDYISTHIVHYLMCRRAIDMPTTIWFLATAGAIEAVPTHKHAEVLDQPTMPKISSNILHAACNVQ